MKDKNNYNHSKKEISSRRTTIA